MARPRSLMRGAVDNAHRSPVRTGSSLSLTTTRQTRTDWTTCCSQSVQSRCLPILTRCWLKQIIITVTDDHEQPLAHCYHLWGHQIARFISFHEQFACFFCMFCYVHISLDVVLIAGFCSLRRGLWDWTPGVSRVHCLASCRNGMSFLAGK